MIFDLGTRDYEEILKLQHEFVDKRKLGKISDSVIIVEHPAVFTIGRSASKSNLLADEKSLGQKGIRVLDVDRGGEITFHGPGQLVVYPIIDLKRRTKDLHRYLRDLEEVAIMFLKKYGIKALRTGTTGVWVEDEKIAFVGVAAKDWITYHGLSININTDLKFFSMINPCGVKNLKVTSLKNILHRDILMDEAKKIFLGEFNKVFGMPQWLKKKIVVNEAFFETKKALSDLSINTVCESSICPNLNECFSNRHATFMILGRACTRACAFCSTVKEDAEPIDIKEPERIAYCVRRLGLRYVIVTSVTRDDLIDGGASQFVKVMESIRGVSEDAVIEFLIPDFAGRIESVEAVVKSGADIIGHNIETAKRLYPVVRKGADYSKSLNILRYIKEIDPNRLTKSAILVGMGEAEEDVAETMEDLRAVNCDILTIGQYLRRSESNLAVDRFVTPEEFERYKIMGEELGFKHVSAGPFVRSSYLAEESYLKIQNNAQILMSNDEIRMTNEYPMTKCPIRY